MDCPDLTTNGLKPIMILGSGGHGSVYLSEDVKGELYATKVIEKEYLQTPLELHIQRVFKHPYIMGMNDVSFGEKITINMNVASGGLRLIGKLNLDYSARLELIHKILDAIYCLHSNGIIHRDIKPDNILIMSSSKDGNTVLEPRLIDFGLSGLVKSAKRGIKYHKYLGTLSYLPYDIILKEEGVDMIYNEKSDMWALGITIYYIFTLENLLNIKVNKDESTVDTIRKFYQNMIVNPRALYMRLSSKSGVSFPSDKLDIIYAFLSTMLDFNSERRTDCWSALQHPIFNKINRGEIYIPKNCITEKVSWPPEGYQGLNFEAIKLKIDVISKIITNAITKRLNINVYYAAIDIAYRYLALEGVRDHIDKIDSILLALAIITLASRIYLYDIKLETLAKGLETTLTSHDIERAINNIIVSLDYILYRRFIYDSYQRTTELKEYNDIIINPSRYYELQASPVDALIYHKLDHLLIKDFFIVSEN